MSEAPKKKAGSVGSTGRQSYNPLSALSANASTPFASLQAAIDFAGAHPEVSSDVCVASGPDCDLTATYFVTGALVLRDGVGVYGGYESGSFQRCPGSETVIDAASGSPSVVFDRLPTGPTTLDGFTLHLPVTVDRSSAITLSNLKDVPSINVDRSTDLVVRRVAGVGPVFVNATSPASFTESVISTPSGTALYVDDCAMTISGSQFSSGTLADTAIVIEGRQPVAFSSNVVQSAGAGILAWDGYAEISDNTVTASATAVHLDGCLVGGTWVRNNDITGATGVDVSGCGVDARVVSNTIRAVGGPQWSFPAGIYCQPGCSVTDNDVQVDAVGGPLGHVYGVYLEDLDAGEGVVLRNRIRVLGSGPSSGLTLFQGMAERNRVAASSSGPDGEAVRIDVGTLRNNIIIGPLRVRPSGQGSSLLVEHNTVHGELLLDGEGGKFFGNVFEATIPVNQGTAWNSAAVWPIPPWDDFVDNDLLPGGATLYSADGNGSARITSIATFNALTAASPYSSTTLGNFSADPLFGLGDHLSAGSPCIDRGAASVTGDIDIDGEPRSGNKDVGADEYSAGPPCGGFSCNGPGSCLDIGPEPTCFCAAGYLNPPGDPQSCVVNECASSPCDPLTTCTNTFPGFACGPCPSGTTGTGDTECRDADQCQVNNGGCDPLTACIDERIGRSCGPCPAGYLGDGEVGCFLDACNLNNGGCDPLTTCTPGPGGPTCGSCPAGYVGDGATGCIEVVCGDVTFVDAKLEAAVRAAVATPSGPITGAQVAALGSFSATGMGIVNLTGLECFSGLTSLDLYLNQIQYLFALETLPRLTTLKVSSNKVRYLGSLPHLTNLNVEYNQLPNLDDLEWMPNLRTLDVSNNPLTNVDGLQFSGNIDWVDLRFTPPWELDGLLSSGIGAGDTVYLDSYLTQPSGWPCRYTCAQVDSDVDVLRSWGVNVISPVHCARCP